MDVIAWLRSLGLEQYASQFLDNAIDSDVLKTLTDRDLRQLGVTALGHRKKIIDAVEGLRKDRVETSNINGLDQSGERRQVSVLFADLVGFTELSRKLDAEELHDLLEAFFERVDPIVVAHGGYLNKHIGDCVMGVFGAPFAYGNDAMRALHAALEIRDAVAAMANFHGRILEVHMGVAGGQVVASATGSDSHREYTMTGDSVNLASRLAAAAAPGEILISDAVMRTIGENIECSAVVEMQIKGFEHPVRAWRVLRINTTSSTGKKPPLVGRDEEVGIFSTASSSCSASRRRGQVFYVRGEAGIGKTRLVEEFQQIARAHDFDCHAVLVLDFGSRSGRDAIGTLVRSLLGIGFSDEQFARRAALSAAETAGIVDHHEIVFLNGFLDLPHEPETITALESMDNDARLAGSTSAVAAMVRRVARARPLFVVVEDIHWADEGTLAHLAVIAAATADSAVVVALTSRVDGDPITAEWRQECAGASLVTLDLGPLRLDEARSLAGSLLAAGDAIERCLMRAAGNPLFLEQLLADVEHNFAAHAVPGSIQSIMQARLDRLDPGDKLALQAASVLGQRFEMATLHHLVGNSHYNPAPLFEQRLLRHHGTAALFSHALLRDAAYETLLKSRRREYHLAAARWYTANDDPVSRAEHLDRADDPAAAAAYLDAAKGLLAKYRYESSLFLAERGLNLVTLPIERYELSQAKAETLEQLGRMREALAAYEAGIVAAVDDLGRCRSRIGLARAKRTLEDIDGAFADLGEAEREADGGGFVEELARIHFLRGNLYFPRGDIVRCSQEHEKALQLARRTGSAELEAMALGGLADAHFVRGRMISAADHFRRCVSLAESHGFLRIAASNRPMEAVARVYGDSAQSALEVALAGIAETARFGQRRSEVIAYGAAAVCYREMGEYAKAFEYSRTGLALAEKLGAKRFEMLQLYLLASLHRLTGELQEATLHINRAYALSHETGMAFAGPRILGEMATITEDPDVRAASLAEAEEMLPRCASFNHLEFRRSAIEACLKAGDWNDADRHASLLEDYTTEEPLPWVTRVVERVRKVVAGAKSL